MVDHGLHHVARHPRLVEQRGGRGSGCPRRSSCRAGGSTCGPAGRQRPVGRSLAPGDLHREPAVEVAPVDLVAQLAQVEGLALGRTTVAGRRTRCRPAWREKCSRMMASASRRAGRAAPAAREDRHRLQDVVRGVHEGAVEAQLERRRRPRPGRLTVRMVRRLSVRSSDASRPSSSRFRRRSSCSCRFSGEMAPPEPAGRGRRSTSPAGSAGVKRGSWIGRLPRIGRRPSRTRGRALYLGFPGSGRPDARRG